MFDDELLPVAARNVSTMRAYIREALFFSENLRPDIQPAHLDTLVRQAVEVARDARHKPVEIITTLPTETAIEADGILIQRLIANLITNAIDASPAKVLRFISCSSAWPRPTKAVTGCASR